MARKVGRCDVGDCFGVDANDLDNRKSDVNSPLLFGGGGGGGWVKTIFKPFVGPIPEPL